MPLIVRALLLVLSLCGFLTRPSSTGGYTPGGATNVISVQLGGENLPVSAAAGFQIGALSAKVSGGGACTTCTFTMVNSGASSDGTLPIGCSAASNDFQVVLVGGTTPTLENLNVISTAQVYGQVNPLSPTKSYICVKATPAVGTPFTQPFSIMVRNATFTAFAPLTVQYTSGVGKTVPLSTVFCWADCGQGGAAPTVSYALSGTDPVCTGIGISISGANLVLSTSFAGNGICHITATAAGVATGMVGTAGSSYVAAVNLASGPYVGPGDATYPNTATGLTWSIWTGLYAYNAAYATAGDPIIGVTRESDQATLTVNATASGDMDIVSLANFCDTSICYGMTAYDQSGNGNNMLTYGAATSAGITTRHPIIFFDAFNGTVMVPTNANNVDRFWWNPGTYNGTGTTGTLWVNAEEDSGANGGSVVEMAAVNTGSNPVTQLQFLNSTGSQIYVGPNNHSGGSSITCAAVPTVLHSMIAVVNGASSVIKIDGAEASGSLSTASLVKPLAFGGGFGGGSLQGFLALPGAVSSTTASSLQRAALFAFDQQHFGMSTSGSC